MSCDPKKKCILLTIILIVVLIVVLVASSMKKLQTHEVGIIYDTIWKKLRDDPLNEGLYTGPPGFEFIIFPSIFETISFDNVRAIDKDGAEIELNLSYQYRVRPKKLKQIIEEFKDHDTFRKFLERIGLGVVQDSVASFNTSSFMSSRAQFTEQIRDEIKLMTGKMHCDVSDIQVANIQVPHAYESAVRAKEAARENIQVALSEEPRLITKAMTREREAETEAEITLQKAEIDARIRETEAENFAKSVIFAYQKEEETLKQIQIDLNLTAPGLISYLASRAISQNAHQVYVGMEAPAKTSYSEIVDKP